jgi:FkbH-like protein
MNPNTPKGHFFHNAQKVFKRLESKGVLLALCSKNNAADIEEIINNSPDFLLKSDQFICKKINWSNKVDNIKDIAKALNLGLDSFVFVDDSDFEIAHVRSELPEVICFQVPKNLSAYHQTLNDIENIFYKSRITGEDLKKTKMYIENIQRNQLLEKTSSIEDFLNSLGLQISIQWNNQVDAIRASQMTQKTNQFNLTTIRLSEKEVEEIISNTSYEIATISVSDKFGDSGTTGLSILKIDRATNSCYIDVFLLSCRIIGRNIEYKFMELILDRLEQLSIEHVYSIFIPSTKNSQVANFYDTLNFKNNSSIDATKNYYLKLSDKTKNFYDYIKLI